MYKKYSLETVNDEVWIPANKDRETTETKGRKSAKSTAAKKRKAEESLLVDNIKPGIVKTEIKKTRKRVATPKNETIKIEVQVKKENAKVATAVKLEGRVTRQRAKIHLAD